MTELGCERVRETIPDVAGGRVPLSPGSPVEAHLAGCEACRDELALARLLFVARPSAPVGFADRIIGTVAADRSRRFARSHTRPWWGLTAAAVAALALGIGIVSEPAVDVPVDVPAYAYEVDDESIWSSEEGLLAGAPLLDGLSEEGLQALLDELSVGSAGGAA